MQMSANVSRYTSVSAMSDPTGRGVLYSYCCKSALLRYGAAFLDSMMRPHDKPCNDKQQYDRDQGLCCCRRVAQPALKVDDPNFPHISFVVISHNHYDHLDYNSVLQLHKRFGDGLTWYVPLDHAHA